MPIRTHACYSATCDACGSPLCAHGCESEVHFISEAEVRTVARALRWSVTADGLICPERDAAHQAEFDALMPAEPAPSNQPPLDGGRPGSSDAQSGP